LVDKKEKFLPQRAIIFQGGGALGAYEAGVFETLYSRLTEEDKENGYRDRPLFDIVAGSSIGAVNAAILVNHVLEKKRENPNAKIAECWEGSSAELSEFWSDVSNSNLWHPKYWIDFWLRNPLFTGAWDIAHLGSDAWLKNFKSFSELAKNVSRLNLFWDYAAKNFPILSWTEGPPFWQPINLREEDWRERWPQILAYFLWPDNYSPMAPGESVRRYYSYWWSLLAGSPNVLSPSSIAIPSAIFQPDTKFFDPLQFTLNSFFRFDNTPLEQTMKQYWDYDRFPSIKTTPTEVKTDFKDNPPRLLLVTVDALDSTTAVTFDSYGYNGRKCEICSPEKEFENNREYIEHLYEDHENKISQLRHRSAEDGIWKSVYGGEQNTHTIFYEGIEINHVRASMSTHQRYKYPEMEVVTTESKKEQSKIFWDGAYLSNTPLRELIQAHQNYWREVKKAEEIDEIPPLEVYIVNLYPVTEKSFSSDADTIQDREIDIKFHDRTSYDLKVAEMTTDYIHLTKRLIETLEKKGLHDDVQKILNEGTKKSRKRSGARRTNKDLVEDRFEISRVVHIERSDDGNTIFGKAFDFSDTTLLQLKQQGQRDADIQMGLHQIVEGVKDVAPDSNKMEQILQQARLSAKHWEIDKMKSHLRDIIEIVESGQGPKGMRSKILVGKISKLATSNSSIGLN
jgi:NTE family protein